MKNIVNEVYMSKEDVIHKIISESKKSALKWLDFEMLPKVKWKDSNDECPQEYLRAILLSYSKYTDICVNSEGEELAGNLDKESFSYFIDNVFDIWIDGGADTKKKYILNLASAYGSDLTINKLVSCIKKWSEGLRKVMACNALKALSLHKGCDVLKKIYVIFEENKAYAVKVAAQNILEEVSKNLNMGFDELCDRLVPTLGFNSYGEKIYDYGSRKFTAKIGPRNKLEVYDENKKKFKTIPKVSVKDDMIKAQESYEELKKLQKRIKETVKIQSMRIDGFLSRGRKWTSESWRNLFIANPIMHEFAVCIIWGLYNNGELEQSFRYCGDGSFTDINGDDFSLDEDYENNISIGIVHPLELEASEIEKWKNQLDDYELIQPIDQLYRKVFILDNEQGNSKSINLIEGKTIKNIDIIGKYGHKKENFYDTVIYGREDKIYRFFDDLSYLSEIVIKADEITLKIYKCDKVYCRSELKSIGEAEGELMMFKEVPGRVISEAVLSMDKVLVYND